MKILVIAQGKGGVGKSTLSVNLACYAQSSLKIKTSVIELDQQGTSSLWYSKRNKAPTVTVTKNKTNSDLADRIKDLKAKRNKLVIIDLPGTNNLSTPLAVRLSDLVLMPARPNEAELSAASKTVESITKEEKIGFFVFTFTPNGSVEARKKRKELEGSGLRFVPTTIRQHKYFSESLNGGFGVTEKYPDSGPAEDIINLFNFLSIEMEL